MVDSVNPNDVTRVELRSDEAEPTVDHSSSPASELALGSMFERYVVVRKLGHGGMGVVYLAYDPKLDRGVALKVLRGGSSAPEHGVAQARLLREAQAMAKLSHPNVLPVYDVGTANGHVFVAMEFVDGRTLGQWLCDDRPRWEAALEVMIGAGRGLEAAHAAGLVHRDFKPDNVMLDGHERPRVMDFGLARAADDDEGSPTHLDADLAAHASASAVSSNVDASACGPTSSQASSHAPSHVSSKVSGVEVLTRTGFVMGTPAYMAPEQHYGSAPDPASDQFSYCVALYEALHGERPFAGDTSGELCRAALDGKVRPPPTGSRVPGWLRRAVVRGLAPRPEDRWPSMEALLTELQRHRRDGRRMRAGVATLALLGAVAGASTWWQGRAEDPCGGGEAALAEVWHDGSRSGMHQAFASTGLAFADEAAARALAGLDAWGASWVVQHRDACEATHVRREQSGEALDLRMRCLRRRLQGMSALTEVLASADPGTVEAAAEAVERLPRPSGCAELETLRAEVPPPDDPGERQRVEDLRIALQRVDALRIAARFDEARAALDEANAAAASLSYPPLQAELGAREGRLREAEGKPAEAVEALEAALWQAEASGMDRLAAVVAIDLLWIDGKERDEHTRGETWATLAGAKLDRMGDDAPLRASLLQLHGVLADAQGRYDVAAERFEAALALRQTHEPGTVAHARALGDSGKTHFRAGRLEQAAATFEQAAEVTEQALGPWHPDVAKLRGNAATAHHAKGDYAKAREGFEAALKRLEQAYGPDHLSVATTLTNLGSLYYRTEDYPAAVEAGMRAIRIKEQQLGPGHPRTGMNLNNVAMAQSALGEHQAALASYQRAEEHVAKLGPEHIALVEPRVGQGEELMHLGRHAEAIAPLQHAYALEQTHGHDPRRLALPAFLLARALWDGGGDRNRARALASEALEQLGDAPPTAEDRRLADAIRAWQTERPVTPGD